MIFEIHSNYELRRAYEILNYWNKAALERDENPNNLDYVREAKREIRNYNKKDDERNKNVVTFFNRDYESYDCKIKLPEWIETKEEAQRWFDENERVECLPHAYDCSGQMFTEFDTVFQNSEGRWMAYFTNAIDV